MKLNYRNKVKITSNDFIRDRIIEKLLTITNNDYLTALFQVINVQESDSKTIRLTDEQISMLKLSDKDIKKGELIPHSHLDKKDLAWLKGL